MSETNRDIGIRRIAVRKTARYALLGEPASDISDVWFVCHGYGQLAPRFISRFEPIASPGRLIVAPEALSRFYPERTAGHHGTGSQAGASWMTSEDRETEIADYVEYLNAVYDMVTADLGGRKFTVRALGFSQGASTVARWIATGQVTADQVILWAGSVPPELTPDNARRLAARNPLMLVVGDRDPFITNQLLDAQLAVISKLGVPYELRRFAGGHEVEPAPLVALAGLLPKRS